MGLGPYSERRGKLVKGVIQTGVWSGRSTSAGAVRKTPLCAKKGPGPSEKWGGPGSRGSECHARTA